MHRKSPGVEAVTERDRILWALGQTDATPVARALENLVTDARRERILEVIERRIGSVTVVLDSFHDPHNGAAILRSCDAFGIGSVHAVESVEPLLASNEVARGSQRWVEVERYGWAADCAAVIRAGGFELVATHPDGELEPSALSAIPRLALVMGNERAGISPGLREHCHKTVRIPMRGFAESLNVSVTAAILLFHATAGRPGDLTESEKMRLFARALVLTVARAPEILAAEGIHLTGEPGSCCGPETKPLG
jgi:tRNA (guanosine-2'-O-)-methyltransferase